jgi:hypothetical protein
MKNLLLLFCLFLTSNLAFSQTKTELDNSKNTNPTVLSRASKTLENSNNIATVSNTNIEQGRILEKYLGINSFDHPEMKSRKQKLYDQDPESYTKMLLELGAVENNNKQIIKRAEYESFPIDKKRFIDTNSDKYNIVE